MREMQDGTISDVKETRTMLKELQEQTLELIELQKGNIIELLRLRVRMPNSDINPEPFLCEFSFYWWFSLLNIIYIWT